MGGFEEDNFGEEKNENFDFIKYMKKILMHLETQRSDQADNLTETSSYQSMSDNSSQAEDYLSIILPVSIICIVLLCLILGVYKMRRFRKLKTKIQVSKGGNQVSIKSTTNNSSYFF